MIFILCGVYRTYSLHDRFEQQVKDRRCVATDPTMLKKASGFARWAHEVVAYQRIPTAALSMHFPYKVHRRDIDWSWHGRDAPAPAETELEILQTISGLVSGST